jgi:hypothetical protein
MNATKISAAINRIRAAAGNPMKECPCCGRAASAPYRRIVRGTIVEGCVDAFHGAALPAQSNTAAWHNRASAQQLRRNELAFLRAA